MAVKVTHQFFCDRCGLEMQERTDLIYTVVPQNPRQDDDYDSVELCPSCNHDAMQMWSDFMLNKRMVVSPFKNPPTESMTFAGEDDKPNRRKRFKDRGSWLNHVREQLRKDPRTSFTNTTAEDDLEIAKIRREVLKEKGYDL